MHRSFSETKFLCYKACIGSGIDVGRAQDISAAATLIGAYENSFFAHFPALITAPENHLRLAENTASKIAQFENISSAQNGSFLADCLQSKLYTQIQISLLDNAMLLAGMCLHLAPELHLTLTINNKLAARFSGNRLFADIACLMSEKAEFVTLEISDNTIAELAELAELVELVPSHALYIGGETWREIEHLAARTYVAENEQSRIAGAGAGLTDND